MMRTPLTGALAAGLLTAGAVCVPPLRAQVPAPAVSKPISTYSVPRTPWGDPDLQGVWSSDEEAGVPFERPRGQTKAKVDGTELEALLEQHGPMAELGVGSGSENPEFTRAASGCALGRTREGLPKMEELTHKLATISYAHSPDVAHMRSLTGVCALKAGNRGRAKELARLARRAFTEQPGVAEFFKTPLRQLEAKLRKG